VKGNYIGTDVAGTVRDPDVTPNSSDKLGNDGVSIQADADDNTIGGTAAGAGNIISGNSGFDADAATGNRILPNSIYHDDALGIDLIHSNDPPDVNLNDDGDPDGQSPPLAELPGHNLSQTHNQANRRTQKEGHHHQRDAKQRG
jgi:hypothetical protein